jgi:hypothetical protein
VESAASATILNVRARQLRFGEIDIEGGNPFPAVVE